MSNFDDDYRDCLQYLTTDIKKRVFSGRNRYPDDALRHRTLPILRGQVADVTEHDLWTESEGPLEDVVLATLFCDAPPVFLNGSRFDKGILLLRLLLQ